MTCASRVFLLESVVHHSFEIQGRPKVPQVEIVLTPSIAIARIDRLGQTRPTEGPLLVLPLLRFVHNRSLLSQCIATMLRVCFSFAIVVNTRNLMCYFNRNGGA